MAIALSLSAAFSMSSQNRTITALGNPPIQALTVRGFSTSPDKTLRTYKNCKTQFDPLLNRPRACRFHAGHFGGETKRKFECM